MDRLKEYHTKQNIPEDLEKVIRDLGWKTDLIVQSIDGHAGVVDTFWEIDRMHLDSHNKKSLASLDLTLKDGMHIIASYNVNPAGEGAIVYANCTAEKAEQCMKVMNHGQKASSKTIAEYLVAADIPLRVSFFDGTKITNVVPKNNACQYIQE